MLTIKERTWQDSPDGTLAPGKTPRSRCEMVPPTSAKNCYFPNRGGLRSCSTFRRGAHDHRGFRTARTHDVKQERTGNAVRNRWGMWEAPSANHSKVVCYLYYTIYVQSKYSVRLESKRELLVLSYLLMSSYTYPKWLKEPVAKRGSGSDVLSAACIMFLWLDLKMLQVSKKKWYDWRVQAISRLKAEIDLPCQTMLAPWSVSYAATLDWFTKIGI